MGRSTPLLHHAQFVSLRTWTGVGVRPEDFRGCNPRGPDVLCSQINAHDSPGPATDMNLRKGEYTKSPLPQCYFEMYAHAQLAQVSNTAECFCDSKQIINHFKYSEVYNSEATREDAFFN